MSEERWGGSDKTHLWDFFMLVPSGPSPQSYAWMVKVCSFCSSQSSLSFARMTPSPVDLSRTTASKGTFCPWILKPQISPEHVKSQWRVYWEWRQAAVRTYCLKETIVFKQRHYGFTQKKKISHSFKEPGVVDWGGRCLWKKPKTHGHKGVSSSGRGVGGIFSVSNQSVFSKPLENIASIHAGRNWKDVDRHFTGTHKVF